jgi:ABC-type lipoprotein export system ATPase subunit
MNEVLIETRDVSKYYKDGNVTALNKVNIKVFKGDFFGIKGPSGSGKSTLLHLLGGLDTPSEGEIYFDGKPFGEVLRDSGFRINNIGFVFQAFYLWRTLNVLENVLLPLVEVRITRKEKLERANGFLDLVGIAHRRYARINSLSMGERQRVAIARALITTPKMILADEPTGSLDSNNAENILELFNRINKDNGVTVVMVTHEKIADDYFSRSVELQDGKIQ